VTFQNAIVLQAPNYNYTGYPPHSGANVVYSGSSSFIEADAVGSPWSSVNLWYTSAPNGLFIDAYDSSNTLLTSVHGGINSETSSLLSLSASDISYVKIHDTGNLFTIDDFTFSPTVAAPEPSTLAYAATGVLTLVGFVWRKRRRARVAA
jgi:hypothetical protein